MAGILENLTRDATVRFQGLQTGQRLRVFNSRFGTRPDFPYEHPQGGGGEWLGGIGMGRITHPLRVPTPRTQEFGGG